MMEQSCQQGDSDSRHRPGVVVSGSRLESLLTDSRFLELQVGIDRAIDRYIEERKRRIPGFVRNHFSVTGAMRINRKAFGSDLVKAPLNVAWALPYAALQGISRMLEKAGVARAGDLGRKVPPGMTTAVQAEVNRLIFTELLELPYGDDETQDGLLAVILEQPEVQDLFREQLTMIAIHSKQEGFRKALEARLQEYAVSRIAISELSGNIIALASGAGMFSKMTPGGISFGAGLASVIAQQSAISSCALGPTIGAMYYGVFPATASAGLAVAATSSVLGVLAVLSAFSGMVTDPIQARLGLHEKRLLRLVESLEGALKEGEGGGLKIREQYLVRVFDLCDLLKTAANVLV